MHIFKTHHVPVLCNCLVIIAQALNCLSDFSACFIVCSVICAAAASLKSHIRMVSNVPSSKPLQCEHKMMQVHEYFQSVFGSCLVYHMLHWHAILGEISIAIHSTNRDLCCYKLMHDFWDKVSKFILTQIFSSCMQKVGTNTPMSLNSSILRIINKIVVDIDEIQLRYECKIHQQRCFLLNNLCCANKSTFFLKSNEQ